MEAVNTPISEVTKPVGTGGFLNPDKIVMEFGIKEGMNISDFGCGAGYFTILVAKKTGKDGIVHAFDVQNSPLDSVMARAREEDLDNIETVRANLEILGSTGLSDQSQDIVLLANILFQSQKKSEIIKEALRVLKEDGKAVIIDWKKNAGSFGPPDSLRTNKEDMKSLTEKAGGIFIRDINAGTFHYGMIFTRK